MHSVIWPVLLLDEHIAEQATKGSATRFAIFAGSITDGFCINQIVSDADTAERLVSDHLLAGKLAQAVEIQRPSSKCKREKDHDEGMDYIAFDATIALGLTLYGRS